MEVHYKFEETELVFINPHTITHNDKMKAYRNVCKCIINQHLKSLIYKSIHTSDIWKLLQAPNSMLWAVYPIPPNKSSQAPSD